MSLILPASGWQPDPSTSSFCPSTSSIPAAETTPTSDRQSWWENSRRVFCTLLFFYPKLARHCWAEKAHGGPVQSLHNVGGKVAHLVSTAWKTSLLGSQPYSHFPVEQNYVEGKLFSILFLPSLPQVLSTTKHLAFLELLLQTAGCHRHGQVILAYRSWHWVGAKCLSRNWNPKQ